MTKQINLDFHAGTFFLYIYCEKSILRDVQKISGFLPTESEIKKQIPAGYTGVLDC
jgi:hypothetical protein